MPNHSDPLTTPDRRSLRPLIILVAVFGGLALLLNTAGADSEAESPCNSLDLAMRSESNLEQVLADFGLPSDVMIPDVDESSAVFLCWHHYDPHTGIGAIDGVALGDQKSDQFWLIVGPEPDPELDWYVVLADYGFEGAEPTGYGLTNDPASPVIDNFWDSALAVVVG